MRCEWRRGHMRAVKGAAGTCTVSWTAASNALCPAAGDAGTSCRAQRFGHVRRVECAAWHTRRTLWRTCRPLQGTALPTRAPGGALHQHTGACSCADSIRAGACNTCAAAMHVRQRRIAAPALEDQRELQVGYARRLFLRSCSAALCAAVPSHTALCSSVGTPSSSKKRPVTLPLYLYVCAATAVSHSPRPLSVLLPDTALQPGHRDTCMVHTL